MARPPSSPPSDPGAGIRLNRFLASCGLGSRRKCETLITEGRVEVNGHIVTEFATSVRPEDHVRVDGRALRPEREITLLLNKPKGYLCTRDDPEGRKTIYDLLPRKFLTLSYVGRLDRQSQGLLILTNSGALNEQLTHPRHQVEKEYEIVLNRPFNPEESSKLTGGIRLYEGIARAVSVKIVSRRRLRVILTQGFNRQIRRMFAKLDYKVKNLERVRIGRLSVPNLSTGEFRIIGKQEITLAEASPRDS